MAVATDLKVAVILPKSSKLRTAMQDFVAKRSGSLVDFDEASSMPEDAPEKVALIVVDWTTPIAHQYVEAVKRNRRTSRTPVIGVYPDGADTTRVSKMTIVPDQTVFASISAGEFKSLADRVLSIHAARPRHFFQDFVVKVPTDDDALEQVFEFFEPIYEDLGYEMQESVLIGYSMREAVGNAAEHGNGKSPDKMIQIAFMVDHDKMCIVITDEGPGFDHRAYVAKVSAESALATTQGRGDDVRPGGLGFHMMRRTCDSVCYNDSGNSIYLMKKLPSAS